MASKPRCNQRKHAYAGGGRCGRVAVFKYVDYWTKKEQRVCRGCAESHSVLGQPVAAGFTKIVDLRPPQKPKKEKPPKVTVSPEVRQERFEAVMDDLNRKVRKA